MEEKRPWHVGRRSLFFCSRFLTSSVNGLVFSAIRRLGVYAPSGHPLSDFFAYSATNAYALDGHRCLWRKAIFDFFGFFIHRETVAKADEFTMGKPTFLLTTSAIRRLMLMAWAIFLPAPVPCVPYNRLLWQMIGLCVRVGWPLDRAATKSIGTADAVNGMASMK